jgi:NADH-quinone oxidoreductase subunit M
MLTFAILVPMIGAAFLAFGPKGSRQAVRIGAIITGLVPLLLLAIVWLNFDLSPGAPSFQAVEDYPWIPSLGVGWRVGVDGIALAVAGMSALVFAASIAWPTELDDRPNQYYAWMLFLEGVSLAVFLVLDLLLFYVFFDLSLVGMFFLIGRWGHGDAKAAALKFFLYTFVGSLAILLAIIALVLASDGPLTFDMRTLIAQHAFGAGAGGWAAGLTLLGFVLGFAIKTPLFPVHTWLPPAHVNAPAPASAILAGVMLKMGTYGLIRIPMSMMPETFARYAPILGVFALLSILWGAFVALGQSDLKRRIAYTSVNHMGYTVLGIAAAGSLFLGADGTRQLALTGAVVEMVAHGLITGALFLMTGVFWQRARTYELNAYGGLAGVAPKLTGAFILAAFASLGLPGLAGFVAEFQIFAGTFAVYPWLAALGLIGILITAALFLTMVQRVFFGELPEDKRTFTDLKAAELAILGILLAFVVLIGVYPRWLLVPIMTAATAIAGSPLG